MFKIILGLITAVVASLHATPAQAAQKANETDATTSATYVLSTPAKAQKAVVTGAERTSEYLKLLKGKRVALFSNQTGVVGNKHVLDVLLENKVNVVTIFSPEHGFRGKADAGEKVSSSVDEKTGVNIYSLYGVKGGAPDDAEMQKFDVLVSDIQDVGLRFYTYYVTMERLMDRCAEYGKKMIVLDRPNPNGMYVDGPLLDMKYKSGVGSLPIPVVHGMTLGELALMINGEGWLKEGRKCDLKVVKCLNYNHQTRYRLPVIPSPNLPNMTSIYLYPSLCYFEATDVSLGRGTDNDIVISDPGTSRHHAEVVFNGDDWSVRDNNSTNGTFLNGEPVTSGTHSFPKGLKSIDEETARKIIAETDKNGRIPADYEFDHTVANNLKVVNGKIIVALKA